MEIIQKVLKQLYDKYSFDSYNADDMYQEGFIIACKALPKYDSSKGTTLSTFLYEHLSRRYINFIRDHSVRSKNHCIKHPSFQEGCKSCFKRQDTQDKKRLLQRPTDLEGLDFAHQSEGLEEVDIREAEKKINARLPKDMRQDYLLMKEGGYVSRQRREEIEAFILKVMND